MAHLVETIAYAGETPWHAIGKRVLNDLTPAQMCHEAGLDWRVEKIPLFADYNGEQYETGRCALIRDRLVTNMETGETEDRNRILTFTTGNWNPVQNEDAFAFFHDFVMAGDMEMHTAGSLCNGEVVWCLAKTNQSFVLHKNDQVDNYFLFTNYHRFGSANDLRMTPIRVVCNNTLTLSLSKRSDQMVKINHRKPFDPELAKDLMGIASQKLKKYEELATFLSTKRYNEDKVKEYFGHLFEPTSTKNKETKVESRAAKYLYEVVLQEQPGAALGEGTWWQAFNAVTYYTNHEAGNRDDTRLNNVWYGKTRDTNVEALNKAVEFAKAA